LINGIAAASPAPEPLHSITMPTNPQIKKLKGHVLVFSEECRYLVQSLAILRPMAENQKLMKRFSKTKRALGFHITRWSLMQECVIGVAKLAYDDEPQNPTAVRLSEVLLALPAKLKEQVKAEFSKPITAVLASGKPETKDDLLVREQMDRAETFELQQAFDDYLLELQKEVE
jgi:hypothetical protein